MNALLARGSVATSFVRFRPSRRVLRALCVVLLLATSSTADAWQTTRPAAGESSPARPAELRITATERHLWLAEVRSKNSRLFHRTYADDFDTARTIPSRIDSMVAVQDSVYVFFENNAIYRYSPDEPEPIVQRQLLSGRRPVHAVASGGGFYAIVPTDAVLALGEENASRENGPASRPFEPGEAELSVALYDGQRWTAVAPCPVELRATFPARLRPRLCLSQGRLYLFGVSVGNDRVQSERLDVESQRWNPSGRIDEPGLTAFWAVSLNGVLTLVTVANRPEGREERSAYRQLPSTEAEGASDWHPIALEDGALPESVTVTGYQNAIGFNQQLGMIVDASDGVAYLRFAKPGVQPSEPTVLIQEVLSRRNLDQQVHGAWQVLTLMVLVGIFAALFIFRRASMFRPVELPPGYATSYAFQRVVGWLIDMVPFAVAATYILGVGMLDATRELYGLFLGSTEGLPSWKVVLWWILTVGGHTAYCLAMELIAQRTVGKVLARERLISETGSPPLFWQIVTRNLMRIVELAPPFWILSFLVPLSRNRQRLGDIFARTLVVRSLAPEDDDEKKGPDPSAESQGSSDKTDSDA